MKPPWQAEASGQTEHNRSKRVPDHAADDRGC
jgi:hypothetical protein